MSRLSFLVSNAPLAPFCHEACHLWFPETIIELATEKPYGARLEWDKTSPEGSDALLSYLKAHMENGGETELWHIWWDGDFDHPVKKNTVLLHEVTANMLREWLDRPVWQEPITDHCLILKK